MLAGLCGTLVSGALNVVMFLNGAVLSLPLVGFTALCLFTFATGLQGWRKGRDSLNQVNDSFDM